MEELSYRRLRELQRMEKEAATLVALPKDYYPTLCSFLKEKKEKALNASEMERREFDNIIRIVKDMSSLRKQKLLFRAVRSGQKHETEGMTAEEHALYDKFCGLLAEDAQMLESVCNGALSVQISHASEDGNRASIKKVKLLKEIPAYKGSDNSTYGPFKPGDEAQMPQSEADWLVKGKFAEVL